MNLPIGSGNSDNYNSYSGGVRVGDLIRKNYKDILLGIFIFIILVILGKMALHSYNDMDDVHTDGTLLDNATTYIEIMYHQPCKSKGGCSRSCPFISEDDPRLIIFKQMDQLDMLYSQTKQGLKDDTLMMNNALERIKQSSTSSTPSAASNMWPTIMSTAQAASTAIGVILNQVKDLDKQFGEQDAIDIPLMDAKNRATALGAAASIQKNIFVISSVHLNSQIMMQYITNLSTAQQQKVSNYDQLLMNASLSANTGATSISSQYTGYPSVLTSTDYINSYNTVSTSTSGSQNIVASMATLLNLAQSGNDTLKLVASKLPDVINLYQSCTSIVEGFSNDLPGKLSSDKIIELIQNNDYESAIIQTALEPDLVSNHQKFAKERQTFESGGGIQSVTTHDNDVNPWVGLFGRPTYRKSNGASVDVSSKESGITTELKSIPSDQPNDLMATSDFKLARSSWT